MSLIKTQSYQRRLSDVFLQRSACPAVPALRHLPWLNRQSQLYFFAGAGAVSLLLFCAFAQTEKNVKKGVDKTGKGAYSSDCSAGEPQGKTKSERVPC
ncbi:MAG: hypothetical protein IJV43_08610, partial [Oscillospiraceae bacterium]|nr:hypothetical protein [Oscillospiraceae bacterium]